MTTNSNLNKEVLEEFSNHVASKIRSYQEMINLYNANEDMVMELSRKLFKTYPFFNPYIKKLITGEPISLGYYNPHLARLEANIEHYNFCSAKDYKGIEGPVVIEIKR